MLVVVVVVVVVVVSSRRRPHLYTRGDPPVSLRARAGVALRAEAADPHGGEDHSVVLRVPDRQLLFWRSLRTTTTTTATTTTILRLLPLLLLLPTTTNNSY